MGLGGADLLDDSGGKPVAVSCSICLDAVTDNGDRAFAKLVCGHQFHLDCIGSAFNIKGAMQCPNCRKIEKGQWLYANGSRPLTEFNVDDWAHDEDLYDLSYTEMSFGLHWCPFSGLTRIPASFDERDFSSTGYHDLIGQHAVFSEQTTVSSATHPCPYVAYLGPIHPSTSNSVSSDGSSFSNNWNNNNNNNNSNNNNSQSSQNEIPTYGFPSMDVQYQNWDHSHSSSFPVTSSSRSNGPDQIMTQRANRPNLDASRPGSFGHPFVVSHGSGGRPGSSTMVPPYPGSVARTRDRVQALQAYFQQPTNSPPPPPMRVPLAPSARRSNGHRSIHHHQHHSQLPSSSDRTPGTSGAFYAWDRDHASDQVWGPPFHQVAGPGGYRQRHGSSQNR